MTKKTYDSSSIQVLEGLEAVRKRPGMYIGSVDDKGLHHLVWEIVDNAIDESLAGYANKITITIHPNQSITIEDNGRGIPIDIHPKTNISTLETVFTVLHAGGKFGGENSGYRVAGGLHGVGASVVNALSKWLKVEVYLNGQIYFAQFEDGGKITQSIKTIGQTDKTGTKVTFLPDFELFNEGVDSFNFDLITKREKETAFLNKSLLIVIIDERSNEQVEYKFDGGIVDFVKTINKEIPKIHDEIIYTEASGKANENDIDIEVAFQYTTSYQNKILSYVNNIATIEGGTHEQGFFDALNRIINNYSDSVLPLKDRIKFSREDIKEGIVAIISIKHSNPMYEGQTKQKFANIEVRGFVNKKISENFERYLAENPSQAQKILLKIRSAADARLAAQKAKEISRRKDPLSFSTLPGKLADCSSKKIEETELFIVEGDSAGGSAKMGRDRRIQAILPLKGKVINAERTRIDKLLINTEIKSMITALGTGIGDEFNFNKIRYGKIIIMTDADVDGSHIRTLLLTFFYRYFLELIERGNIYIACPPLYKVIHNRKENYIYTDKELEKYLQKLGDNKYDIQRYKGLGEMNDTQLWNTTMNPETRKLLRVKIDNVIRAKEVFTDLMGEFVEPRREFITKNAQFAKIDA